MKLNNKGLTLVELLISIVLIGIVLAFLFGLLLDLKEETDNNDFAYNNQVNRLEVIYTVEQDLIKYVLLGIEDASTSSNLIINFYFRKGSVLKTATLENLVTTGNLLSEDKYYLKYTSVDGEVSSWLMKGAKLDSCGSFTYLIDSNSNNYYFHLNLFIYNSIYNERNNREFNNTIDDIEISYAGDRLDLSSNSNYLTNTVSGEKQIGYCTN